MADQTNTQQQTVGDRTPASASVKRFAQPVCDEIWASLFASAAPGAARSVMMTAAGRREGVSTLLAGAALTGASLMPNQRIALVDLNVRTPRLAGFLGVTPEPGLADVLGGNATLEQIARPVGSANLLFYPAGRGPAASAMLRNPALGDLVRQILSGHEYVLCDCAAANLYPDVQVLAPLFDGVVLVAEAGATRRESLAQAKKRVEQGAGRVLGVILNKRRYPVPRFLYRRS
ncbi:MAG: hypothetical protein BIFFINMI_03684 [Phycisphaerae bacterium]|nr:hypothetical protein [Phycisphaerae bacterium]